MAGINFIGSYSGMDQSVIDKLMAVERRPLILMNQKKADYEAQKNAWKDVLSRLKNLSKTMSALSKEAAFLSKSVTSSDTFKVSATGGIDVAAGNYRVSVSQTATKAASTGTQLSERNPDVALGLSGSLTLSATEGTPATIQIEPSQSLRSVLRSISRSSDLSGVEATVVDGRLIFSAKEYGDLAVTISASAPEILTGLGLDTITVSTGKKAIFEIDGLSMERDTNVISDAVMGMTLNLKELTGTQPVNISVQDDIDSVVKLFENFIDQYNSTLLFIKTQTAAGIKGVANSQGALRGQNALVRLQGSLRQLLTSNYNETGSELINMSEIGITTIDREGTIKLEIEKLKIALQKNPRNVQRFISDVVERPSAADPLVFEKVNVGMGLKIESMIASFTDTSRGTIANKSQSLDWSLTELSRRMDTFKQKMEKKEAYYLNMFAKLDVAMQKSESQSSWLTAQLGGMRK